ncbi:MAG: glutamate-cysteine ligase family protein [Gemmatimonadota bacterium]|nr:glutamate-cysteine ligase family protein [Gemmatimonadota bacterium]
MSLSEAMLLEDVRQRLFSPTPSATPRAVGAELELIPVDAVTRAMVPVQVSAKALSRLNVREGWAAQGSADEPTSWRLPDGASISFEPGGQIEISSALHETASSLIESLQRVAHLLEAEMEGNGIALITRGVDPCNDIASVPLQLQRDRYIRMTNYFNSVSGSGIRMMRQTAALQINVERGDEPIARWRLLNALAPVVTALFANSREYAGSDTGFASYRAQLWRTLDHSRTGLAYSAEDSPFHYLRFALDAVAIRSGDATEGRPYHSFRNWMRKSDISIEDWNFHLSTLFPEVRPKSYFELRSADSIDIESLAAPIVFVTGLIYDPDCARRAGDFLGEPSPRLLETAGRDGLRDSGLREIARELAGLSLHGAEALGERYLSAENCETARKYFARALDGQRPPGYRKAR